MESYVHSQVSRIRDRYGLHSLNVELLTQVLCEISDIWADDSFDLVFPTILDVLTQDGRERPVAKNVSLAKGMVKSTSTTREDSQDSPDDLLYPKQICSEILGGMRPYYEFNLGTDEKRRYFETNLVEQEGGGFGLDLDIVDHWGFQVDGNVGMTAVKNGDVVIGVKNEDSSLNHSTPSSSSASFVSFLKKTTNEIDELQETLELKHGTTLCLLRPNVVIKAGDLKIDSKQKRGRRVRKKDDETQGILTKSKRWVATRGDIERITQIWEPDDIEMQDASLEIRNRCADSRDHMEITSTSRDQIEESDNCMDASNGPVNIIEVSKSRDRMEMSAEDCDLGRNPSKNYNNPLATKASSPYYEYLPHTADIIFHAWGKNFKECMERLGVCMFSYMTDLDRVEVKEIFQITASGRSPIDLLYHFLDELLFLFLTELHVCKYLEIVETKNFDPEQGSASPTDQGIDQGISALSAGAGQDENLSVTVRGYGERLELPRHTQGTEIKAITMHEMRIKNFRGKDWGAHSDDPVPSTSQQDCEVYVLVDI